MGSAAARAEVGLDALGLRVGAGNAARELDVSDLCAKLVVEGLAEHVRAIEG